MFVIVCYCLVLFHCGVCDAVGGSCEAEYPAVVHGTVDDGGSHWGITEYGSPPREFQVRGIDDGLVFVGVGYDLVE